jgi:hypothetical protein
VEVRQINRSSSATRQPKVDTSTNMLCLLAYWTPHLVVAPAAMR